MRDQYVIIVGGGELTMPAYRFARENLGLCIAAMDFNLNAPGMHYADRCVKVSTKDVETAVAEARKLAVEYDVKGVFTCGADVEVTVAAIAEDLGLPGIPLKVANRCNDKVAMHNHLDSLGFTQKPLYSVAFTLEEAKNAAIYVGYPCVVKPVDNCGSRGVQRIENPNELEQAFCLAKQYDLDDSGRVIVEQCLIGSKHTVEMINFQDKWHLLSIIDTHYISPRWPCELGLNTSTLPLEKQQELFVFARDVSRLMGIDFSAHKVDVNIDADGQISLIELTGRLSGGYHCQYASPLAYGSNDILAALKLSVGMPLDLEDICHRYAKGAAVRALFPKPGRIKRISGVEQALKISGVEYIFFNRGVGDLIGPYLNSTDRVAFVIAVGKTTKEAIRNAEQALDIIKIDTE